MSARPSDKLRPSDLAAALEWAATSRSVRADVVARLRSGELDLGGVIDQAGADDLIGRIKVLTIVEALPGWGKVVSRRTLEAIGVAETTPLADADHRALLGAFGRVPS